MMLDQDTQEEFEWLDFTQDNINGTYIARVDYNGRETYFKPNCPEVNNETRLFFRKGGKVSKPSAHLFKFIW